MPVTTINVDDFLTEKQDGEFVTAAEWNKLVALFTTLNNNAYALLDTQKAVDANAANILSISAGAVPDESITANKLATTSTTKQVYTPKPSTVTTPVAGVTYYTYDATTQTYTAQTGLTTFTSGEDYYTVSTVSAGAAISNANVIADKTITGTKIADATIDSGRAISGFLGGLFNSKLTFYTDLGLTGTIAANTSKILQITVADKPKAIALCAYDTFCILNGNTTAPDLYIGTTPRLVNDRVQYYDLTVKMHSNKNTTVQEPVVTLYYQPYKISPGFAGILNNVSIRLNYMYYSADTGVLTASINNPTDYELTYEFGTNIIGL